MADPLKQICDELGVCKEEAVFYLEGFRWDLNAAIEACRSRTLPPTENERDAAEERMRNDLITQFVEVATGSSTDDAYNYLSRSNWNLELAVNTFYANIEKNSNPPPLLSHEGNTETWYPDGFSGNEGRDVMQDVLSKVPQFHNASMDLNIRSPPSASTPPVELKQESINQFREIFPKASSQAVIDCLTHGKGNVQDAIDYFYGDYSKAKTRPGIATAQVVKNYSGMAVEKDSSTESPQHIPEAKPLVTSSQVEESGNPTETLPLKEEESAEVKEEEDIGSFVKMTGASREDAIALLEHFKWDVNQAVKFFEEHGYSAELISALSMSLMENNDPPLPSTGLPSQSQFEAPTETQRSLEKGGEGGDVTMAIPEMAKSPVKDILSPTTKEMLNSLEQDELIDSFIERAGGGVTRDGARFYLTLSNWNVDEAFSFLNEGPNTTQVQASQEGQVDGKAVEEGSSMETVPDTTFANQDRTTVEETRSTIMITIILADGRGTELVLPFRSNQTIRDIRNAIDEQYLDKGRGSYFLKSMDEVDYFDSNTTVSRVCRGDSTTLIQTYPDDK